MKSCRDNNFWRPLAGAMVAGLWACCTAVVGAPPSSAERVQTPGGVQRVAPSLTDIPIAPPVHAYRTQTVLQREGLQDIAVSLLGDPIRAQGSVADGALVCFRNSDCDDCDLCTTDLCVIPSGQFSGTCSNNAAAVCGPCSDGDFCNGQELCNAGGQCRPSSVGPCVNRGDTICDSLGGEQQFGDCVKPCKTNAECDDASKCTGVEVCQLQECVGGNNAGAACTDDTPCTGVDGYCGGVCRGLGTPCGSAAGCTEPLCTSCCRNGSCNQTTGLCQGGLDAGLNCVDPTCTLFGRCCVGVSASSPGTCSRKTKPECATAGGDWLNAGDAAGTPELDEGSCTQPAGPTRPNAGEWFNCPNYAAGIVPLDIGQAVGQVGAATCNPLQELGDDYSVAGCGAGQFFKVKTVRWVGGFQVDGIQGDPSRYRLTFRDLSGQFIEDTVTGPVGIGAIALRTVILGEEPTIPCQGILSIRAAVQFSPFAKFVWATANSVQSGTNDENALWINGALVDYLTGTGNNRLAFELVGEVVDEPKGACCNSTSGVCTRELPWVCEIQNNFFQGIGTFCKVCNNNLLRFCNAPEDCPVCSNDPDPLTNKCDPNKQCPGGTCVSGACALGDNNGDPCDPDVDCTAPGTCGGSSACDTVPPACTLTACCDDATGECTEITAPATCGTGKTSLGFGTSCEPDCCPQVLPKLYPGYDTCAEASDPLNLVTICGSGCDYQMPEPGEPFVSVTFSGNNSTATFGDADPVTGTCQFGMFQETATGEGDRGWWHAFSTSACSNIRVDFCCTAERSGEVKQPQYANLWSQCNPCGTTESSSIVGDESVGAPGMLTDSNNRGAPFCNDDDLWETYGPLPAGTYWVPVFSDLDGTFGDYQMHVTVAACPLAACCLKDPDGTGPQTGLCIDEFRKLVFDGGGAPVPCTGDVGTQGDCAANQECSLCAEVNVLDCQAAKGFWNGFGNIPLGQDPVGSCDFGTCDFGSCCTGAGKCQDRSNPLVPCDRGTPSTCMSRAQCAGQPNGSFTGEVKCDNPTPPCPTCEFVGPGNCQLPLSPNDGYMFMSDVSASGKNGIVSADDFIPASPTLSKVCVWGAYIDPNVPATPGPRYDCTPGTTANDQFRIRVFNDAAGIPGTLLGQSTVTGDNIAFGSEATSNTPRFFAWNGASVRGYTLTLDTPITGMAPGATYWLEVANATFSVGGERCEWHWLMYRRPLADGELYAVSGISPGTSPGDILAGGSVYVRGSERPGAGLGFCLGAPDGQGGTVPLDFASPPAPVGCCWTCAGEPAITTLFSCMPNSNLPGTWVGEDPTCALPRPEFLNDTCCKADLSNCGGSVAGILSCGNGIVEGGEQCDDGNTDPDDGCDALCQLECGAPPGEAGDGPRIITNGLFNFDTGCGNTDGPTLSKGEGGDFAFVGDIWYEYKATCTGVLVVDQCATQTAETQEGRTTIDAAITIYHNYDDPFNCPCPGAFVGRHPWNTSGGDDNCNGQFGSAGFLREITLKGECWLIRSGSWAASPGVGGEKGRGLISVSCEQVDCFPSAAVQAAPVVDAAGATTTLRNNRFLSFQGGNSGKSQAVRVKFVSLPAPWDAWNGATMFVGEPFLSSELGSKLIDEPPSCASPGVCTAGVCVGGADNGKNCSFKAARLQCDPHYRNWAAEGVVHVFHEGIVPSRLSAPNSGIIAAPAKYDIQLIEATCAPTLEPSYGPPLTITNSGWADLAKLQSGQFRAGEDKITVDDTLAMLAKFSGTASATTKPRNELSGVSGTGPIGPINGKIEVSDLLALLNAFGGQNFPFGPTGPKPCSVSSVAGR